MRLIPELMIKKQNSIYTSSDKFFKSVFASYRSSLTAFGDLKELVPDFYSGNFEVLLNLAGMEFGGDETVADVELPPWAEGSAQKFCEIMRDALESDVVSEQLHHWIDLVFG
jgi:factor associated with neutral sphingomyelinase activation